MGKNSLKQLKNCSKNSNSDLENVKIILLCSTPLKLTGNTINLDNEIYFNLGRLIF